MRRRVGAALVGILLLSPGSARAVDFVYRVFDQQHGLPTDDVTDVAQDALGFLWIATPGGLVRFDGDEMRLWTGSGRAITMVRASPEGEIVAVDDRDRLFRVHASGVEEFLGPDRTPIDAVVDVQFDRSGVLWVVRADEMMRRSVEGGWTRLPRDRFGGEILRHVRIDGERGVFALTREAVWHVSASGKIRRELAVASPLDVRRQPDGAFMVLAATLFIAEPDGRRRTLLEYAARPIDLLEREGSVWVAYDRFVVRVARDEAPLIIGPEHGLPGGGRLFVDREGSLWVCSFRGLIQFPEPESDVWTERDGLPSTHARFLGRNAEGIWTSTWAGLARIVATTGGRRVAVADIPHSGDICIDGGEGLWYGGDRLYERRADATTVHPFADVALRFCTPSRDGTIWLGAGAALVNAGPGRAERVAAPPGVTSGGAFPAPLLEDRAGRLWVGSPGRLCHADVSAIREADPWTCESLPDGVEPIAMIEVGESLWLGTHADGVYRRADGSWTQIPASRDAGGGRVFKLRGGSDGGVWVLGLGRPTRVLDRPASEAGWEVVEVLSGWHGHPSGGASDLLEEADGTIWTASAAGVARIPGFARRAPRAAPRVELAGAFVDGRPLSTDDPVRMVHRRNLVELRFAALTYRDRSLLRYQVRLADDDRWTTLAAGDPVFRFAELPAGSYVAEFRASLDGRTWSPAARRLSLHVSAPWYLQPWFFALAAAVVAGLLLTVHRARMRLALRLERQRTQIAMDLHDEIGSGLGSIGILAGVAGGSAPEGGHSAVLKDISDTASELSTSLGDIVWSLRVRSRTLQELMERLAERGHRLFPHGSPEFVCRLPDLAEPVFLTLAVQRNVLLIAVEALHNAASHAGARRVELRVTAEGTRWRIAIDDDGCGFDVDAERDAGGGMGLSSMRRRASEIGASLDVLSAPSRGTVVSVSFHPRGIRPQPTRMSMRGGPQGLADE